MINKNIRALIKKHSAFFAAGFCLCFVSMISMYYGYFRFLESRITTEMYGRQSTAFSVEFKSPVHFSELSEIISECSKKTAKEANAVFLLLNDENKIISFERGQNLIVNFGRNFTGSAEIVLSLSTKLKTEADIGESIPLLGRNFKIVGTRNENCDYNEIQYSSIREDDEIVSIHFQYAGIPSERRTEKISDYLTEQFGGFPARVSIPEKSSDISRYVNAQKLTTALIILFLTIINLIFICRYILEKRKYSSAIMRICGCTKKRLTLSLLAEFSIYITFALLAAFCVFRYIVLPFAFENYVYGLWNYIIPPFVCCLILDFTFLIAAVVYSQTPPIRLKQEGKRL